MKVIASIKDPPVTDRILRHLDSKNLPGLWPESRAPQTLRIGYKASAPLASLAPKQPPNDQFGQPLNSAEAVVTLADYLVARRNANRGCKKLAASARRRHSARWRSVSAWETFEQSA